MNVSYKPFLKYDSNYKYTNCYTVKYYYIRYGIALEGSSRLWLNILFGTLYYTAVYWIIEYIYHLFFVRTEHALTRGIE